MMAMQKRSVCLGMQAQDAEDVLKASAGVYNGPGLSVRNQNVDEEDSEEKEE